MSVETFYENNKRALQVFIQTKINALWWAFCNLKSITFGDFGQKCLDERNTLWKKSIPHGEKVCKLINNLACLFCSLEYTFASVSGWDKNTNGCLILLNAFLECCNIIAFRYNELLSNIFWSLFVKFMWLVFEKFYGFEINWSPQIYSQGKR